MKKLFLAALSTFLVLGMAACKGNGQSSQKEKTPEDFSADIIKDGDEKYGMVGPGQAYINGEKIAKPWGDADASQGVAEATSLRDVAQRDVKVAEAFQSKDLKGLYKLSKVELGHQAVAGYMKGAYDEKGEYVERDGVFTVKFAHYAYDDETAKYAIATWIPSPEAYSESLTPSTWWAPLHQEEKDEHGLAHDSDCVNLGGAGEYTYYLGVYKKAVEGSYFGLAVFKDKALDPYTPPAEQVIYSIPGAWNGWNNAAEMEKVNDNQYKAELNGIAADQNGRIVSTGSWTTVADVTNVTVGADLVEDDGGGDHNFKFKAAGDYTVTLNIAGDVKTISIVKK